MMVVCNKHWIGYDKCVPFGQPCYVRMYSRRGKISLIIYTIRNISAVAACRTQCVRTKRGWETGRDVRDDERNTFFSISIFSLFRPFPPPLFISFTLVWQYTWAELTMSERSIELYRYILYEMLCIRCAWYWSFFSPFPRPTFRCVGKYWFEEIFEFSKCVVRSQIASVSWLSATFLSWFSIESRLFFYSSLFDRAKSTIFRVDSTQNNSKNPELRISSIGRFYFRCHSLFSLALMMNSNILSGKVHDTVQHIICFFLLLFIIFFLCCCCCCSLAFWKDYGCYSPCVREYIRTV